jgi:hypothetical protein
MLIKFIALSHFTKLRRTACALYKLWLLSDYKRVFIGSGIERNWELGKRDNMETLRKIT